MRLLIALLLLCSVAWSAAFTSKASGNWSSAGQTTWTQTGVPGDGDTVVIGTGHAIVVDTNTTIGASGTPYYSYVTGLVVKDGGAGATTATVTAVGGTTASLAFAGTATRTGGAITGITLTQRGWYAPDSVAPTVTCGNGTAECVVEWVQGGGTPAITINGSGSLTIAAGMTFTDKGGIIWTETGTTTDVLTFGAGANLAVSNASAAAGTIYYVGGTTTSRRRINTSACTALAPCSITGVGTAPALAMSSRGTSGGLAVNARYTTFTGVGDAKTPISVGTGATNLWDVQSSRFLNSAGIDSGGLVLDAAMVFRHNYNTHEGTLGVPPPAVGFTSGYAFAVNASAATSTGERSVVGDAFDLAVYMQQKSFILTDSYYGSGDNTSGGGAWTQKRRNFYRSAAATWPVMTLLSADMEDSYLFADATVTNPHWVSPIASTTDHALSGAIIDAWAQEDDPGEVLLMSINPTAPTTHTLRNSISMPTANGAGHSALTSFLGGFANLFLAFDHNTWWGSGMGAVQYSESGYTPAGHITARSNIAFVPGGYTAYKFYTVGTATPTEDVCVSAAACDYNLGYGYTATQPCVACTNQTDGYGGKWSVEPGQSGGVGEHDLDHGDNAAANPRFVDHLRGVALFDSKYLGNSATAWDTRASDYSFSVGDFVSNTDANVYAPLAVNYRCTQAHTKGTDNSEPGVGSAWRTYWELASLYRLRQNLGANYTTFPRDGALEYPDSCSVANVGARVNIICQLMGWTRKGFVPQAPAAACGGHDGATVGHVNVCLKVKGQLAANQTQ